MNTAKLYLSGAIFLSISVMSTAQEKISFKGIEFGMNEMQIAELGGGDTELGCVSAILGADLIGDSGNQPWTYGGIDVWNASCMEDYDQSSRVPGISGMFQLLATVDSDNYVLAKSLGGDTYSVDELAGIFSKVFGKFEIETTIVKSGFGQEFVKKVATATHKDAVIRISDRLTGSRHENYIDISITSLDYLNKKNEWEKIAGDKKLNDARSDF